MFGSILFDKMKDTIERHKDPPHEDLLDGYASKDVSAITPIVDTVSTVVGAISFGIAIVNTFKK